MCTTDYDDPGDVRSSAGVTDLMLAPVGAICLPDYVHDILAAITEFSFVKRCSYPSNSFRTRSAIHSGDRFI